MVIEKKRTRGTRFVPLIRFLENFWDIEYSSIESFDESSEEIFGDDIEIKNFYKCQAAIEIEIAQMLIDYLCSNEPLINGYFTEKKTIEIENKKIRVRMTEDNQFLLDYVKRFSKEYPEVTELTASEPRDTPIFIAMYLLIAIIELSNEYEESINNLIEKYNTIWKTQHFQTTIFDNLIKIINSSLNAIQTTLALFQDNGFIKKLYMARKLTFLKVLNLISIEFNIPLETLTASNLKIDDQDLKKWLELLRAYPSISEIIKRIEKQERYKEKGSPPDPFDPSKEFYKAKPVSSEDIQLEFLKDIFHFDFDTMEDDDFEKFKRIYKEAWIKYYEFL